MLRLRCNLALWQTEISRFLYVNLIIVKEKQMKRFALVAALLALSLTACGEKPKAPAVEAPVVVTPAPAAPAAAPAVVDAAPAAGSAVEAAGAGAADAAHAAHGADAPAKDAMKK